VTRALLAGLAAGYGIAVPIGAVGTYLVAVSARSGMRGGAFGALGIASADAGYAAIAVLGGAALAQVIEPWARPLQLASVVVLLAVALGIALRSLRSLGDRTSADARAHEPTAARSTTVRQDQRDARTYLTFLGMTVLNPMTVVYFAALVLGGQGDLFSSAADRVAFVLAAALASASWQLLLATGGAVLGRLATGARGRLVTGLTSSVVIAVLALRLV
jgi:arginine exporter protein ArgO